MQLRKLALAVGLASVLGSDIASALGLGEIKLNSTLNQPLDAEIKLLQTRDLGTNEILVGLASREEFSRAGVDRSYNLIDLKFTVNLNAPGGPVVKVTSEKAIQEPYLNFLLETQWPSGRLLREYTLLLDLPVFADAPAAPVQQSTTNGSTPPASRSTSSRPTNSSASSSTSSPSSSPSYRSSGSQYQGDEYGPVSSADTLWDIALKVRPGRNFSVQQTMLAIQRLNPEAFINNNINLLRKGQVLRVPSADQITAVSKGQAVNEVAYQNASWTEKSPTTGPQLDGRSMAASEETSASIPEGRLKLSSGGGSSNETSGRADGVVDGDVDAMQNDLAASLEELDRSKRENTELKDRVSELEAQIQTMERLVSVSSEQLRALQLASEGRSDQEAATPAVSEEPVTADAESDTVASTTDEPGNTDGAEIKSDIDTASAEDAPIVEQKPAATQPTDVSKVVISSSSSQDKSLLDIVFDNIAIVGAALLALILGLVLFLRKRSQQEADSDDDYLFVEETEAPQEELASEDDQEFELDEELDEVVETEEFAAELDEEPGIEPETADVVSEADIYIAYGKLDQAEEILTRAIQRDGTHTAARLKLMEVFAEQNNLAAFDDQYREIVGDPEVEERAEELRLQFGNVAPFVAAAAVALSASSASDDDTELDAEDDFDLSLDLDTEDAAIAEDNVELTDDAKEITSDFDLGDFELDEDNVSEVESENLASKSESESEAVEVLDDDFSLDLEDLDFSDIEDAESAVDDGIVLNLDEDSFALGEESELRLTDADIASETELNLVDPDALDELSLEFSSDDDLSELKDSELEGTALEDDVDVSENEAELADDDELGITLDDAVLTADAEEFSIDFSLEDEAGLSPEAEKQSDPEAEVVVDTVSDSFDVDDDFTPDSDEFDLDSLALDADLEALDNEVDALAEEIEAAPKPVSVEESLDEMKTDLDIDSDFEFESTVSLEEEALFDEALSLDIDSTSDDEAAEDVDEEFDLAADLGIDLESEDEVSTDFDDVLGDLPTSTEEDLAADAYDEDELDSELDFLADTDESSTKLDLARAYIDMGDSEGAKDILSEVVEEGNPQQKQEAEELMERLS